MAASFDDESDHFAQRDYSKAYPIPALRVIPSYPSVTERYFDVRFFVPLAHVAENKNAGDQCILFHSNRICMITIAPHHPLLPKNDFGLETTSSSESFVNSCDFNSWQSFIANVSKRTIESIDFSNGSAIDIDDNEETSVSVSSCTDERVDDDKRENVSSSSHPPASSSSCSPAPSCSLPPASSLKVATDIPKEQLVNAQKHNRLLNNVRGKRKKGGQKLKERSIICQVKCTDGSVFSILAGIKGILVEINEALLTQPNLLIEEPWSRGYVAIIMTRITRVERLKELLTSSDEYYKEVAKRREIKNEIQSDKIRAPGDTSISGSVERISQDKVTVELDSTGKQRLLEQHDATNSNTESNYKKMKCDMID